MDVFGLIGYPLTHSFSKKYFEEKFKKENIATAKFELFPLQSLTEFIGILTANPGLKGLAVTIPHKVNIIPYLSEITSEAKVIGAVNCIQFSNGRLIGHNTDAIGFEKSLRPLLKSNKIGAMVLGSGGASKAITYVLQKFKIPFLIVSREAGTSALSKTYKQIDGELLEAFPLIINCSPVGMHPLDNTKPDLPYHLLTPKNILYDLIYNPEETEFLKKGKARGCAIKNGMEMLHLQAEVNWKVWNKVD